MEEATVFLGLSYLWNQALPQSPYSIVVNGEKEGLSENELKNKLLTFFQDFKSGGG